MSVIVTICGRKFECVPGTNLLRDVQKQIEESELSATDLAIDQPTRSKVTSLLKFDLACGHSGQRNVISSIGALAALATCAAIMAIPTHLLRPASVVQTPVASSLSAQMFTSSSDTVADMNTAVPTTVVTSAADVRSPERPKFLHESSRPAISSEITKVSVAHDSEVTINNNKIASVYPDAQERMRDIAQENDVEEIHQRLASLGYYFGPSAAAWGQRSREALKAFKRINGIGADSVWDQATEVALFSPDARKATNFVGTWAEDESACMSTPAVIRREGARAGDTFCAFGSAKLIEGVWNFTASCSDARQRWTVNVRLAARGDRLTWTSESGTEHYVRCSRSVTLAQAK